MSGYEGTDFELAFSSLIEGIELAEPQISADELRIVPMDYKRVGLNAMEGRDLRDVLLDAHRKAVLSIQERGLKYVNTTEVAEIVTNFLGQAVLEHDGGDAFAELFALDGVGWYGLPGIPESDFRESGIDEVSGTDAHMGNGLLNSDERLFGCLNGLAFGEYHVINPEMVRQCIETGRKAKFKTRVGALISIAEVKVCESQEDGLGSVDREHPLVYVPVSVEDISWHRAYPID